MKEKFKAKMPVPAAVNRLHSIFKDAGHKLYAVGGSVRDFYLHTLSGTPFNPKDHDLVTDLHPDKVVEILRDRKLYVREVGKSFGVVLVNLDGNDYEIATFREDAKTGDGRRPDFVVFSDIVKDSERRDLTINALYYDLEAEEILDFHGGLEDLRTKKVRFVGSAFQRITEDKLRVLRFVRFHCRISDGDVDTLDKEGGIACFRLKSLRPEVSEERIRDEFLKGLKSCKDMFNFLEILFEIDKIDDIFDGLVLDSGIHGLIPRSPEAVIAAILEHNDVVLVRKRLHELKYTAQEVEDVCFLLTLSRYYYPEEVVKFKKARKRSSLPDDVIVEYAGRHKSGNPHIIQKMLDFPFPNFRGEEVMKEGFEGKALGDEMERREIVLFKGS